MSAKDYVQAIIYTSAVVAAIVAPIRSYYRIGLIILIAAIASLIWM